jgi:large subunit ribosomal protein L29
MKKKDKDVKQNLSLDELRAEIKTLREKKFRLEFKHRVTPLQNALELRSLRRDIARLQTWSRKQELKVSAGESK